MTQLEFRKMHGLGNDFVIVDDRDGTLNLSGDDVRALSDRHLGIGCDQFITLEKATDLSADIFMRIHNPDGSEAEACGNATRCVASLIMRENEQSQAVIQTRAGLLNSENLGAGLYQVDMGPARSDLQAVDVSAGPLSNGTVIDMGNPHIVFVVDDAEGLDLSTFGPKIESHSHFPNRTNVEVVEILSPTQIRMRVWERGAGITQACGSGACAALVATAHQNLTERKADVVLDGGTLTIEWLDNGNVLMTGPVATSFLGTLDLSDFRASL